MTELTCPECDYGEDGEVSIDQLSSHVNASADHPDWSDVRDQVIGDEEPPEEGVEGGGPDESTPEEQGESNSEASESELDGENERDTEGTESGKKVREQASMPDDQEYDQQQEQVESQQGDNSSGAEEQGVEGGSERGHGGGLGIPMPSPGISTTWIIIGAVVVAMVAIVYLRRRSSDSADVEMGSEATDDEDGMITQEEVDLLE